MPESGPTLADFVAEWRACPEFLATSFGVYWRPGGPSFTRVHSAQDGLLPVNLE